jgi:hypothetical protein
MTWTSLGSLKLIPVLNKLIEVTSGLHAISRLLCLDG